MPCRWGLRGWAMTVTHLVPRSLLSGEPRHWAPIVSDAPQYPPPVTCRLPSGFLWDSRTTVTVLISLGSGLQFHSNSCSSKGHFFFSWKRSPGWGWQFPSVTLILGRRGRRNEGAVYVEPLFCHLSTPEAETKTMRSVQSLPGIKCEPPSQNKTNLDGCKGHTALLTC